MTPAEAAAGLLAAARAGEPIDEQRLMAVAPDLFASDAARGAFWTNVYHAVVLDRVRQGVLTSSVKRTPGFFAATLVNVGGRPISLHGIEHGLLRCNRPAPWSFWRPLRPSDPRVAWMLAVFDPRIHFALNCGARSCPPIAAYDEARWHAQLDLATASYLATEARAEGEAVVLPALMRLYARDFPDPRAFAAQHATTPVRARLLAGAPVRWGTYDWTIGG